MILTRFPFPGTTEFPLRSNTYNDQVSLEKQISPDGNDPESSTARSFLFVLAAGSLEAIFLFTATVFCLSILWIKLASGLKNFRLSIFLTLIYLLMSSLDVHSLFCLKWGLIVQSWPAWNSLCIPGCHQLNSDALVSASQALGLRTCATTPGPTF